MFVCLAALALGGPEAPGAVVRLGPALRVDRALGLVHLDAEVAQRDAALELLLCPKRSKEHETILAADFVPSEFQVALLLAGAAHGRPARFKPEFQPPTGQRIKIWVETETAGRVVRRDLREWIRAADGKPLTADFVFAGSMVVRLPEVDQSRFLGDDGNVVCVANFSDAIIDIADRSSDKEGALMFHPRADLVPPRGSAVKVIFEPLVD